MMAAKRIPFDEINNRLMDGFLDLLWEWFPEGRLRGNEFLIGNLKGDLGESLSINIRTGKWRDFEAGIGGPDALGLYAALFHGTDRVAAARELGPKFGLMDGPANNDKTGGKVVHLRRADAPGASTKPKRDEWLPQVPAPGNAGNPDTSRWDHVFPHYDGDGVLLRYIVRNDAKGSRSKQVLPLTWGTLNGHEGWHYKHAATPRHLYGLDKLSTMPDAVVIVVMGEKKSCALQDKLQDRPVLTWTGGDKAVKHTDWSPVRRRKVIIWPDADQSGLDAAETLATILLDQECAVWTIDVTGQPEGWDADDAINGDEYKWDADQITAWVKSRLLPKRKTASEPNPEAKPQPSAGTAFHGGSDPLNVSSIKHGVIPLGHDNNRYFYLSLSSRKVVALSPSQHHKLELMSLASTVYFWERTSFQNPKGGIAWDAAADHLMSACHSLGIFDPSRIRGRGAWLDEGRAVLHLGNRLIVDGQECDLLLEGSRHVYESAVPLSQVVAPPLPASEAKKVLEIFADFEWTLGIHARLAAGWVAVAPISGAVKWRPSVWITGPSGSGKSAVRDFINKLLSGVALNVASKTSEAGIRQALTSDARPVLFDEFEGEDIRSKARVQEVLDLVRQSSTEGGAEIIKGTSNQSGAKHYNIRSAFAFSSINVSLQHGADENRVTVLSIATPPGKESKDQINARSERWKKLTGRIAKTATTEWCAGLVARSVLMAATIRKNAETFSDAASVHFGSKRMGDQIGTLLAGAYSLESDDVITAEAAEKWVQDNAEALDATETDVESDERRLLNYIMTVRLRVSGGDGIICDRTIGELVAAARGRSKCTDVADAAELVPQNKADAELRRNGIRYQVRQTTTKDGRIVDAEGIWIGSSHPAMARHLAGTQWSAQWHRSLIRMRGTEKSPNTIAFSSGLSTRAVWVPITVVLPE